MPCTTMIGATSRYKGPYGSVLPPEARQARRFLKLLGNARLASRALLDAAAMVRMRFPDDGRRGGGGRASEDVVGGSGEVRGRSSRSSSRASNVDPDAVMRSLLSDEVRGMDGSGLLDRKRERHRAAVTAEDRMALALYRSVETAVERYLGAARKDTLNRDGDSGRVLRMRGGSSSGGGRGRRGRRGSLMRFGNASDDDSDYNDDDGDLSKRSVRPLVANEADRRRFREDGDERGCVETAAEADHELHRAVRTNQSLALEALHLQLASRTTSVWGRKKIYQVYALPGPVRWDLSDPRAAERLREDVEREFRCVFHGGGEDQSGVRVYALLRDTRDDGTPIEPGSGDNYGDGLSATYLYVQLNIGKPLDLNDESLRASSGEKKRKKGNEFVCVLPVRPMGERCLALTASRTPTNSRYTSYVLAALRWALCCDPRDGDRAETRGKRKGAELMSELNETAQWRVGGGVEFTGTEPYDLLALAAESRGGGAPAAGRFARFRGDGGRSSPTRSKSIPTSPALARSVLEDVPCASDADPPASSLLPSPSDPLLGLHSASTSAEHCSSRSADAHRLNVGSRYGRGTADLEASIALSSGGRAGLMARNAAGVIVDHDAEVGRRRKRARVEDLGSGGSAGAAKGASGGTVMQRVCWKWSGDTSAASACWDDDDDDGLEDDGPPTLSPSDVRCRRGKTRKTRFKCGIILEGQDVFNGLRALVDVGVARAPLPNYVRDAAALLGTGSSSATIAVDHGEYGRAESFATV